MRAFFALLILSFGLCFAKEATGPASYAAKDYSHLYGMPGFNGALLKMHFELYQGYVNNTNMLLAKLSAWDLKDKSNDYTFSALKRRLGWEYDGVYLHELYFENLGGKGRIVENTPFYQQLVKDFGSYNRWKADFIATGLSRGIGWVILYQDPIKGRLINVWIEEHDLGHLAGGNPLLVMDVFEHAYITQYGLDRSKYIGAFFDNIDWLVVSSRYKTLVLDKPLHENR